MIHLFALGLVLFGCFLGGIGAVLVKKGADNLDLHNLKIVFKNKFLGLGLFLYLFSVLFYMIALHWEELTNLYPFVSTTYLWTTFFSVKFLGEKINKWKLAGLLGIVLGIFLICLGS